MKLVSFEKNGKASWGVVEGDSVRDLGAVAPSLKAAVAAGLPAAAPAGGETHALADVTLLPVIPNPAKVFCVGVNYDDHRLETGRPVVAHPTIFTRFADSQAAHGQALLLPRESANLDFEGELAVVIGKGGRRITAAEAMAHVAGYSIYQDGSVRDWQNHTSQFTPGKNFPRTGGFGPWLVTPDEIGDPSQLSITTRLNGEVVQQAPCSDMIFTIPQIIEYLSAFTPLSPGDVIATGTPGGVGAKRNPPLWMKAGDVVEVEVPIIGVLRNPVEAD